MTRKLNEIGERNARGSTLEAQRNLIEYLRISCRNGNFFKVGFSFQNFQMIASRLAPRALSIICVLSILFFIASICHSNAATDVRAMATLDSSEIRLGEAAQLSIAIEGSASVSSPNLPIVAGLEFTNIGRKTNLQFINGAMSGGVTFMYQVVPQREGQFIIPEISIMVGRDVIKTSPVNLKVSKSSSSYRSPQPSTSNPSSALSNPTSQLATSDVAMIQLDYPKRDFYVGELVPVEINAYFRQGIQARLNSLPTFRGNAFSVSKLNNKPEQSDEILQGIPYTLCKWHTAIAAVKSGEYPLGAQLECTILVSDSTSRQFPFGGGFDDPFFNNFFRNVQEKRLTLATEDTTIKILPLPSEGRPADFSGAIGRFVEFSISASRKEVTVGDPITLTCTIGGVGNFDRVQAPEFEKNKDFKTYNPNSKFEPTDNIGFSGKKIFEQVVVPQNTQADQIPSLKFSVFDPETRRYVTLTSNAIPLKVLPSSIDTPIQMAQNEMQNSIQSQNSMGVKPASARPAELVANKLDLGNWNSEMTPIIFHSWFYGIQGLPITAFIICWSIAYRRNRLKNDPAFARSLSANQIIAAELGRMDKALKTQDTIGFFTAARKALQEKLGERFGLQAEAITLSEINTHFQEKTDLIKGLQSFFETADAVVYSGQTFSGQTLNSWRKALLDILLQLEKIK